MSTCIIQYIWILSNATKIRSINCIFSVGEVTNNSFSITTSLVFSPNLKIISFIDFFSMLLLSKSAYMCALKTTMRVTNIPFVWRTVRFCYALSFQTNTSKRKTNLDTPTCASSALISLNPNNKMDWSDHIIMNPK